MQKLRSIFSNSVIVVLLIVLGLGLVLFLSNQSFNSIPSSQAGATLVPATPIDAVKSTRIPTVIPVIVTVFPTPTSAPSPTPTPTFEPLSDKPIMGFVFKPPQEIPNTRNSVGYWEIIEWLPGNSTEVLAEGPLSLKTVNVLSGTVKTYATFNAPGTTSQPVWLPESEGVAYLSYDSQAKKTNLLLGQAEGKTEVLLSDVQVPLIPLEEGQGVAVYHKNDQAMKAVSPNKQNLKPAPQPIAAPFSQMVSGKLLNTAYQPGGDWIAYYNVDGFRLVNSKSGEVRSIDLGGKELESMWVMDAKWSPDGQKLALIITQGELPIPFSDLYILDWPVGTLRKVDDTFSYITDIAWAPNSKHLLLKPIIDETDEGFAVTALYITDVSTPSEIVPVPIPREGLTGSGRSLSWSPDGQTVLVEYFNGRETAIYKVQVVAR